MLVYIPGNSDNKKTITLLPSWCVRVAENKLMRPSMIQIYMHARKWYIEGGQGHTALQQMSVAGVATGVRVVTSRKLVKYRTQKLTCRWGPGRALSPSPENSDLLKSGNAIFWLIPTHFLKNSTTTQRLKCKIRGGRRTFRFWLPIRGRVHFASILTIWRGERFEPKLELKNRVALRRDIIITAPTMDSVITRQPIVGEHWPTKISMPLQFMHIEMHSVHIRCLCVHNASRSYW